MRIAQAWIPSFGLEAHGLPANLEITTDPWIRLRECKTTVDNKEQLFIAIETPLAAESVDNGEFEADFRRIGKVLARLEFTTTQRLSVLSAAIFPADLPEEPFEALYFLGSPSGISLTHERLATQREAAFYPELLGLDVPDAVQHAITWFLGGLSAKNYIQQVLFFWIGLEALAPLQSNPMRCPACERVFDQCPECGESTLSPAVNKTVQGYLRGELGVSGTEANKLYSLRCRVAHGNKGLDPDTAAELGPRVARIEQLLLLGIKKALGIPALSPPNLTGGLVIEGVPALVMQIDPKGVLKWPPDEPMRVMNPGS